MITWKCDVCEKSTYINPPTEPQFEEKEITVPIQYIENNEVKLRDEVEIKKIPKMTIMKRQNSQTGKIENIPIQKIKDLKPRTYIARLSIGDETIQKDFCRKCLEKVKPELQALWDKLDSIKSK